MSKFSAIPVNLEPWQLALAATLVVLASVLPYLFPLNRRSRSDLPPGPPGELFFGNSRQAPASKPWVWFKELHDQYGDIIYLQIQGPTPYIVLGSAQAAYDLLEKRGSIYSGRPRFIMGSELLSANLRGLMHSNTDFWRRWRKLLHGGFMQKAVEKYRPIQTNESKVLMHDLLTTPDGFRTHLERYAASVIVLLTYGKRVTDYHHDPVVEGNTTAMGKLNEVNIPGKYSVETFPFMKYMPTFLAPWKKYALEQQKKDEAFYFREINILRKQMAEGNAPKCFAVDMIRDQKTLGMSDIELAYAAATPFDAGVETSSGTLSSFLLAATKYGPQFISKAQAEIDAICGNDRQPTFEDMPDLPYVTAIMHETMRWRSIAILGGTPHATTQEDYYRGYYIPKGATVCGSLYSIHSNEADFPDADNFIPERFLDVERIKKFPGQFGHVNFGWGRRVCPGIHLGFQNVFLITARLLWGFNIKHNANIATGPDAFTDGFDSEPLPFKVGISVRSTKHAEVIKHDYAEVTDFFNDYQH